MVKVSSPVTASSSALVYLFQYPPYPSHRCLNQCVRWRPPPPQAGSIIRQATSQPFVGDNVVATDLSGVPKGLKWFGGVRRGETGVSTKPLRPLSGVMKRRTIVKGLHLFKREAARGLVIVSPLLCVWEASRTSTLMMQFSCPPVGMLYIEDWAEGIRESAVHVCDSRAGHGLSHLEGRPPDVCCTVSLRCCQFNCFQSKCYSAQLVKYVKHDERIMVTHTCKSTQARVHTHTNAIAHAITHTHKKQAFRSYQRYSLWWEPGQGEESVYFAYLLTQGSPRVQQNGQNGDYLQNRANALCILYIGMCLCTHVHHGWGDGCENGCNFICMSVCVCLCVLMHAYECTNVCFHVYSFVYSVT